MSNNKSLSINIGVCGPRRSGKSTFVNMICQKYLNKIGFNNETDIPTLYQLENKGDICHDYIPGHESHVIRSLNISHNDVIDSSRLLTHSVRNDSTLLESLARHHITVNLYEIPTPSILSDVDDIFEWINRILPSLNLIIYIGDIQRRVDDKNDQMFLEYIIKNISCTKTKMMYLLNKCDDMCVHSDRVTQTRIDNTDHESAYQSHQSNIEFLVSKHHASSSFPTGIHPISLELAYIYMIIKLECFEELDDSLINKLCKNECGNNTWKIMNDDEKQFMCQYALANAIDRLDVSLVSTGYDEFVSLFQSLLKEHSVSFLASNIERLEDRLLTPLSGSYETDIQNILSMRTELIDLYPDQANTEHFWERVRGGLELFINETVGGVSVDLYQLGYLLPYARFDILHTTLHARLGAYNHIVSTYLWDMRDAPYDFLSLQRNRIVTKILGIYEQLASLEYRGQRHLHPSRLSEYLTFISNNSTSDVLEIYCHTFLSFLSSDIDIIYQEVSEGPIINLLKTLRQMMTDQELFKKRVTYMLFNRQNQMAQSKNNVGYFLSMKEYLDQYDQNRIINLLTSVNQFNLRLCVKNQSVMKMVGLGFGSDSLSYEDILIELIS